LFSEKNPAVCEEAEREIRAAVVADPLSASAHYALGDIILHWMVRGLPTAAAIPELREAVRLEPDFPQAHAGLGSALGMADDVDGAIAEFRESIRLGPDGEGPHFELLQMLEQQKGLPGAVQAIEEDVQREPSRADHHFDLVQLYRESGNLDGVIAECNEAIRLNPNNSTYHFVLGHALLDGKGDAAAAIPQLREAVRLEPTDELNRYNLGVVLLANKNYDEALVEIREARRLSPISIPGMTQYIAMALLGKGDTKGAIEELRPLIADVPDWPIPHALLAVAYARLSRFKEALKECSEARKLSGKEGVKDVESMCDEVENGAKKSK